MQWPHSLRAVHLEGSTGQHTPGGWSGPADPAPEMWPVIVGSGLGFLMVGGAVVGVSPDPYLAFVAAAHDGGLG